MSRELKVGDVLTAATILISLIGVLVSWSIDRKIRLAREADEIRAAAASRLGDLERWRDLALSIYTEVQPHFVDASELVVSEEEFSTRAARVERARDLLWKRISEAHGRIRHRAVDEKIDSGYTRLFGYYPTVRNLYQETLSRLRSTDDAMVRELLAEVERSIVAFARSREELHSADIGKALRATASQVRARHQEELRRAMRSAEEYLVEKIEADSESLLKRME